MRSISDMTFQSQQRDTDKQFYEAEPVDRGTIASHAGLISGYLAEWVGRLRKEAGGRKLRMLELGSGSCVLASLMAREDFVESITCTDISAVRMNNALQSTVEVIPTNVDRLAQAEMDFNRPFPFSDGAFDIVFCDAALHHARSMWFTLAEVNRVLKPGGVFIAQRERFLMPLTQHIVTRRMLTDEEFEQGVSENSYTMGQYNYYLAIAGFRMEPIRIRGQEAKTKLLAPLNGIAFGRYVLWSTKTGNPKYSA
ncbi:MAG: class I SAM-dependent methyltransferase [Brevundimonas sp.]|nr:MAG: class I SAM-dependent methyltransferase [Brevundimonas sp.]